MFLDTLGGNFTNQNGVVPLLDRDQADIRSVPLVPGPGVSDLDQRNPHRLDCTVTTRSGWHGAAVLSLAIFYLASR